ncbi:MAG TPA: hypothetical protein VEA69_12280 [Tepidisphaeraceae bacterium]|nr:hypothetical protein [Tepidisphaeraceae bacterium]
MLATSTVMDAFARAVFWTAGLIDGLVTSVLGPARGGRVGGRFAEDAPVRTGGGEPFAELRRAIVGRSRAQIAAVLGVPPTASVGFGVAAGKPGRPPTYMDATTWYYPFDQRDQKAIAIRFVGQRAREVEVIGI